MTESGFGGRAALSAVHLPPNPPPPKFYFRKVSAGPAGVRNISLPFSCAYALYHRSCLSPAREMRRRFPDINRRVCDASSIFFHLDPAAGRPFQARCGALYASYSVFNRDRGGLSDSLPERPPAPLGILTSFPRVSSPCCGNLDKPQNLGYDSSKHMPLPN